MKADVLKSKFSQPWPKLSLQTKRREWKYLTNIMLSQEKREKQKKKVDGNNNKEKLLEQANFK